MWGAGIAALPGNDAAFGLLTPEPLDAQRFRAAFTGRSANRHVFALLLVAQFWKAWGDGLRSPGASRSYALLLLVIVAFTIYGGWLGGYMVYAQGIGVR